MKPLTLSRWLKSLIAVFALFAATASAQAQTDLKGSPIQGQGYLQVASKGVSQLSLDGSSPEFGNYSGYSQVAFASNNLGGEYDGKGVVVLQTPSGDQLVGNVTWITDNAGNGQISFTWCDSVVLSDGTVAHSTGGFAKKKPSNSKGKTQGHLVVIAIIAILIG